MWRYFKAAFLARPDLGGIKKVPVNILVVVCLGILGFGSPLFWWIMLAFEVLFIGSLVGNVRFRKWADAQARMNRRYEIDIKRDNLVRLLSAEARSRLDMWERKCKRVLDQYQNAQADSFVIESNRGALSRLMWLYLKLLISQRNIKTNVNPALAQSLSRDIAKLESELEAPELTDTLRESKSATLELLRRRRDLLQRREQQLVEINSDLTRIEAQINLAVENAAMQEHPQAISINLDLVSQMLDTELYGDSADAIAELDVTYSTLDGRQTEGLGS